MSVCFLQGTPVPAGTAGIGDLTANRKIRVNGEKRHNKITSAVVIFRYYSNHSVIPIKIMLIDGSTNFHDKVFCKPILQPLDEIALPWLLERHRSD